MLLNIPFYKNNENGNQCLQVGMQTAIKYFLNKDYSLSELDKMSGRRDNLWTWTSQIVVPMYELGLNLKYYAGTNFRLFQSIDYIKKHFKNDANIVLAHTDMPVLIDSINKLEKYDLFELKNLKIDEIITHIDQNHLILVTLDNSKLYKNNKPFEGHMIVLTGYDKSCFYYHESGPENPKPNSKVTFENFTIASDLNGKDEDIVIVFGKNNNL
jgi:hypothetical protein